MVEHWTSLQRAPALPVGARLRSAAITVEIPPPRAYVRLQIARRHIPDIGAIRIADVSLPTEAGHCVGDDPAAFWMSPEGWLLTSRSVTGPKLQSIAHEGCVSISAAAVDVSDALVAIELHGPRGRELLARGCGLDVSTSALGVGQCVRTRLAQLAVIVRPVAEDIVELIVDRGPAAWLCDWIEDAATGLDA